MAEKEHFTVQEVAEMAGVTSQAIYQKMNKTLKPFVITLNKRKYLHRDCLKILLVNEPTNENQETKPEPIKLQTLERMIEVLTAQLAVKDKQINQLNESLSQALKNQGMNHAAEITRQIEAPGAKRSWIQKIFNKNA